MDYITKNKVQISYMDFRGLCVRWALYSIEISPVEELFLPGGHLEMAVISPPMSLDEIDIKKQCRQLEFFQAPALPLYRIIIVLYFHYLIGYFKFLSLINQTEDTFSIHLCQGKHIHIVF